MSNLISGKEALIALASGEEVEFSVNNAEWLLCQSSQAVGLFIGDCYKFRLKPRTITLNGIEVPAPFEPKDEEVCWTLSTRSIDGYGWLNYSGYETPVQFGAWRTEEEIKKVVGALRKLLNP